MTRARRWTPLLALPAAFALSGCEVSPLLFPLPMTMEIEERGGTPSGGNVTGTAGEELAPVPVIRIRDENGNPVPGVRVRVSTRSGGGAFTDPVRTSDATGRIHLDGWTLGETVGQNELRIEAEDHAGRRVGGADLRQDIDAHGIAGAPSAVARADSIPLSGQAGSMIMTPLQLVVMDRFGNPVSGVSVSIEVVAGEGQIPAGPHVTDGQGVIRIPNWNLGPEPGLNRVRVSAPGVDPIEVEAVGLDPGAWTVSAIHLNQGSQTLTGEIPLIDGRAGLLRIFLRGPVPSGPGVRVRVLVRMNGSEVVDEVIERGDGQGIEPGDIDLNAQARSWNLHLPAAVVGPGMGIQLHVDPDGLLDLPPDEPFIWPAPGSWHEPAFVDLPTFRATFIPIQATYWGLTGRITSATLPTYLGETLDAFPIADHDLLVRDIPMVYDGSFQNPDAGWRGVLDDIRDLRIADGALDRYYHGILQRPPGSGIAGMAYVASQPAGIQNLAAVSFDQLPLAPAVIAHEFGHNFGRSHAPCGLPAGAPFDPSYPHAEGRLGVPGYSSTFRSLVLTSNHRDVMSYCFPLWPSDYTFRAILDMRLARPVGAPGAEMAPAAGPAGPGILVGGGWSEVEGPYLRPAIMLDAPATPSDSRGDVLIEVLDTHGTVLASNRYFGAPIDHAEDETLRHFGAVLALAAGGPPPARVRVTTPLGEVTRSTPGPISPDEVAAAVSIDAEPGDPDRVRIRWDAERWPVIVLRHGGPDGPILGFLRSGDAHVDVGVLGGGELPGDEAARAFGAPGALHLTVSDGVTSVELPFGR